MKNLFVMIALMLASWSIPTKAIASNFQLSTVTFQFSTFNLQLPDEDPKLVELRSRIGIDYSMPDFDTSSINEKVIGTRLAKMLKYLDGNTNNYNVYSYLSSIQLEQIDCLNYVTVESYKIKNISKQGDVITIKLKTKLKQNAKNIKSADLLITFDKGISESQAANDLFCDLGRYIKD